MSVSSLFLNRELLSISLGNLTLLVRVGFHTFLQIFLAYAEKTLARFWQLKRGGVAEMKIHLTGLTGDLLISAILSLLVITLILCVLLASQHIQNEVVSIFFQWLCVFP